MLRHLHKPWPLATLALALLLVLPLPGCAPKPIANPPAAWSALDPAAIAPGQYRQVYDAGRSVLREAGFQLARQDYRFGEITTKPLASPTLFEPWKRQNTTPAQAIASTLQDLRRRATLTLTPTSEKSPSPTAYQLRIKVFIQRHQVPTRYLSGTNRPNAFAKLEAVPDNLAARGVKAGDWARVGRDGEMEQRLLNQTLARASH